MAERKGEIKASLPQLDNDLQMYQRELDDYRATLRYVDVARARKKAIPRAGPPRNQATAARIGLSGTSTSSMA